MVWKRLEREVCPQSRQSLYSFGAALNYCCRLSRTGDSDEFGDGSASSSWHEEQGRGGMMNNDFTVIESRMETDGGLRHIVQAPGGTVVVLEDDAGNLSGRVRAGYIATDENEEQTLARAFEVVRELREGSQSAKAIEMNRIRNF